MKNFLLGLILGLALIAFQTWAARSDLLNQDFKPDNFRKSDIVVSNILLIDSATNTISVPKFRVIDFDTEYKEQGVCLRLKEVGGAYTYLTAKNGILITSSTECQ